MNDESRKRGSPKLDAARTWSLTYRLVASLIASVSPEIAALGLEAKELFVLASIDEHPYPAELAEILSRPTASVTVYVKHLEAEGLVRREIDASDLRRHRLGLTPAGRKVMARGLALLSDAFGARLGRLTAGQQAELASLLEKMS